MCFRQPRMYWHQTGLHAEAEEGECKGNGRPERCERCRTHCIESEIAAKAGEHAKSEQDGERTDVCHEQVQKTGAPVGRILVLVGDEEVARHRHQFPCHHEDEGIVCQQHQQHAGREQTGKQTEHVQAVVCRPRIRARRKDRRS